MPENEALMLLKSRLSNNQTYEADTKTLVQALGYMSPCHYSSSGLSSSPSTNIECPIVPSALRRERGKLNLTS